jgi:hypothetical protein
MIYMIRVAFLTAAVCRIPVENAGNLRKHSVVASGVPHHVAREEANMAAIHPLSHPTSIAFSSLPSTVLLAQAAPAAHLRPHYLHKVISLLPPMPGDCREKRALVPDPAQTQKEQPSLQVCAPRQA